MPGGLLQLVSFGAQNLYLNGNPSLSFFKKVYKTHTNFAYESIRLNFNRTTINHDTETHLFTKIDRNADLLNEIYFVFNLPEVRKINGHVFRYVEFLGETILEEYHINIGGNVIDRQYGEWLHIWNELSLETGKRYGYEKMIGNTPDCYKPDDVNLKQENQIQSPAKEIQVPLKFWFNNSPGLALPLIALQYHDIEIHIKLRPLAHVYVELKDGQPKRVTDSTRYFKGLTLNINPYLECNYIFLDNEERTFFSQSSLDYLIEQVNRFPFYELTNNNILDLKLQNPIKEIIWVLGRNDRYQDNKWLIYGDKLDSNDLEYEILRNAKLTFNGLDRIDEKDASFFSLIQPYQHHTCIPKTGLYLYSFSLYPEKFQPSGSCNMSRINKVQLHMTLNKPQETTYNYDCMVYTTNYNFLRVTSGLAGVAFAC
jgi:hypothetical protein